MAKLKALFPECDSEGKIDFDKLRATLGEATDSGPGRFTFSWAGKDEAIGLLQTPSRGTLKGHVMPMTEKSPREFRNAARQTLTDFGLRFTPPRLPGGRP